LVYSGRGSKLKEADLSLKESRSAVDLIFKKAEDFFKQGINIDILTVDNHSDGVYLYLKLKEKDPQYAAKVLELLRYNGGNSSGVGIGCADNLGFVHADQFWGHYSFGNVREKPFSQIWTDLSDNLMKGLKDRKKLLKGRCSACKYLDICNGNFRVRAESVYGDIWAPDPACYINDDEIGVKNELSRAQVKKT
jgi:radical SAM protein with 4Fe4S-binding SPASM domain